VDLEEAAHQNWTSGHRARVRPPANHSVLALCVAVQGTKRREIYGEKLREEEEEARGGRRKKRAAMAMGAEKSGGTNLVEGKEGILRMRGRGCARGEAGSVGGGRRHVWVGRKCGCRVFFLCRVRGGEIQDDQIPRRKRNRNAGGNFGPTGSQ
jgi:hypothetical protein